MGLGGISRLKAGALGVGSRAGNDNLWRDNQEPLMLIFMEVMLIKETGRLLLSTYCILTPG